MSKYFDFRIDSDPEVNNLIWLREYDDGTIKVVREYDGVWKWDEERFDRFWNNEPNIICNSQNVVTDDCLGVAIIAAWKANGSPDKKPEKSKEYISNILMAPLSAKAHLLHGDDGCFTVKQLTDMGVEVAK
jgi:hypothetical protein